MGKKKAKKLKSAGMPSAEKLKAPAQTDAEEKFNFGGLPNINLKKNLGCG